MNFNVIPSKQKQQISQHQQQGFAPRYTTQQYTTRATTQGTIREGYAGVPGGYSVNQTPPPLFRQQGGVAQNVSANDMSKQAIHSSQPPLGNTPNQFSTQPPGSMMFNQRQPGPRTHAHPQFYPSANGAPRHLQPGPQVQQIRMNHQQLSAFSMAAGLPYGLPGTNSGPQVTLIPAPQIPVNFGGAGARQHLPNPGGFPSASTFLFNPTPRFQQQYALYPPQNVIYQNQIQAQAGLTMNATQQQVPPGAASQAPPVPSAPKEVQRHRNRLAIIDPETGRNVLDDVESDNAAQRGISTIDGAASIPSSEMQQSLRDSHSRETPISEGEVVQMSEGNDVPAQFATQVAQAALGSRPMDYEKPGAEAGRGALTSTISKGVVEPPPPSRSPSHVVMPPASESEGETKVSEDVPQSQPQLQPDARISEPSSSPVTPEVTSASDMPEPENIETEPPNEEVEPLKSEELINSEDPLKPEVSEVIPDEPAVLAMPEPKVEAPKTPEPEPPQPEIEEADASIADGGKATQKPKSKAKQKHRELNQKWEEKRGDVMEGDLDAFVTVSPVASPSPPVPSAPAPALESGPVNDLHCTKAELEDELEEGEIPDEEDAVEKEKVLAKNAENAKKAVEADLDQKSPVIYAKLDYKEGQWSPENPDGRKVYDRGFLLALQEVPISLKKPEGLPNLDVIKDRAAPHAKQLMAKSPRQGQFNTFSGNKFDMDFTPVYLKSPANRGQQGLLKGRGSIGRGTKAPPKVIDIKLSLSEKVELHAAENAWKPKLKRPAVEVNEPAKEDLAKKVRGILNKLTPEKFETLVNQVRDLPIDTKDKLEGVIDLVFDKAVDEPNFANAYASMCQTLAKTIQVPLEPTQGTTTQANPGVNFRKVLLVKCQQEFEAESHSDSLREKRQAEIDAAETEEKKKELQVDLEEQERLIRRRYLGIIRFIGELFKLGMLTVKIMHECVQRLFSGWAKSHDEDSLECLCKLLSTIGKQMEDSGMAMKGGSSSVNSDMHRDQMNSYFKTIDKIVKGRSTSSRVRFMLQDVIELRENGWRPRREDNNPKRIDQIRQEAKLEELQKTVELSQQGPIPRKRPDDMRRSRGLEDSGWSTVGKSKPFQKEVDTKRITNLVKGSQMEDIRLGPGIMTWSHGSRGGLRPGMSALTPGADNAEVRPMVPMSMAGAAPSNPNRFSALSTSPEAPPLMDKRSFAAPGRSASQGREGPLSVPTRMEKALDDKAKALRAVQQQFAKPPESLRPSRSQGSSQESSRTREGSGTRGPFQTPAAQARIAAPSAPPEIALMGKDTLSEEQQASLEERAIALIDQYLHDCDETEVKSWVIKEFHERTIHLFVKTAINRILERSTESRHLVGGLLSHLVKWKVVSVDLYVKGLREILEVSDDLSIDVGKYFWDYLGEIIGPMFHDGCLNMSFLKQASEPCISAGKGGELLSGVLRSLSKNSGHAIARKRWKESQLDLRDFLPENESVSDYIKSHNLAFLEEDKDDVLPLDKIFEQLDKMLKEGASNEEVFDWIDRHLEKKDMEDHAFIRALMTSIAESAIQKEDGTCKLLEEQLRTRRTLLHRFLDTKEELEIQSLYALQRLMVKLNHPQKLLHAFFEILVDVISEEAFLKWENSDDPKELEGKGVVLKSVTQFLTWLKEAEYDEDEAEDSTSAASSSDAAATAIHQHPPSS